MSSFNKKLIALLSSLTVVFFLIAALMVNVFSGDSSEPLMWHEPISAHDPKTDKTANEVGHDTEQTTIYTAAPVDNSAENTSQQVTVSASLSSSDILQMLMNAVNKTKAYSGNLSAYHSERFDANVTQCTGGSLIASLANKLVGTVLEPTEETLQFSGGQATNSDGNTVTALLPQKGLFSLTMDGVASISAEKSGNDTVIYVTLIPESVGMYDIPSANAAAIGYLDIASLDISILEVTAASIQYTGSTIKAVIDSEGYISYAEYKIPLHVEGTAKSGFISGSAVFDGMETEIWRFER